MRPPIMESSHNYSLNPPFHGCNGAPIFFWYGLNLIVFFFGLICTLIYHLILHLLPDSPLTEEMESRRRTRFQTWYIKFHIHCEQLASACNVPGKMMIVILSFLNQISWTIDIVELTLHYEHILDTCNSSLEKFFIWLDFFFNLYFFIHFVIRMIAASNKIRFWIQLSSIVDLMTVPSSLFAAVHPNGKYVVGKIPLYSARVLNYIRALRFITYTDALVYLGILKTGRQIRLSQLILTFIGVWFAGSGIMFVTENAGDFWAAETHAQKWSYWETNYFLLVTMSTVGYGDFCSKTIFGRIFICIFILTALAMFASSIPEIMSLVSETNLSTSEYIPCHGQPHVIVCGGYDPDNMRTFLKGFFHQDYFWSSNRLIKMVIVCSNRVEVELTVVFKQFAAWIHRFDGTVVKPSNISKIRLQEAAGVIILSRQKADDPDEEDSANLMNIMAVKVACAEMRIIVLLHRYKNKFLLQNFPLWKSIPRLHSKPDLAICLEELKMGLLAQNCLAPGASALLVNLLINIAADKPTKSWREQYIYGAANEIYGVNFSKEFENIPFSRAAMICYKRWGVCLLAVDVILKTGKRRIIINPSHSNDFVIKPSVMRALVLAQNQSSAHNLLQFCYLCQFSQDRDVCSCSSTGLREAFNLGQSFCDEEPDHVTSGNSPKETKSSERKIFSGVEANTSEPAGAMNDITGTFHWCPSVDIADATMTPLEARGRNFHDHFIVCLLRSNDQKNDFSIGLCNFVMPLRFNHIARETLKDVVVVGEKKFIASHEWTSLKNFPQIFIIDGNALNSAHLTAAGIHNCEHCVIVSASKNPTLDREMADKNTLLCGMNVLQVLAAREKQATLDIISEENLHYFSSGVEYAQDCKLPIQLTEPFSRGTVFCSSVLFSTLSSAHYSPEGLGFVLTLISGASDEVERMIGEGFGLLPEDPKERTLRYGCHLKQMSMFEPPFSNYRYNHQETPTYGHLFMWALSQCGILCLGLYRMRKETSIQGSKMYFVYTNPPPKSLVVVSDRIFCLIPPTLNQSINLDTSSI